MGSGDGTDAILDAAEEVVRDESAPKLVPIEAKAEPEHPQHQGILQLGPREWRINASLRDHYAKDFEALRTLASPRAHKDSAGQIDGYVLRLERYGLAHQAGFRNGDVVHSVNGHELGAWSTVLAAYQKLRRKNELEVTLTRRNGKRLRLVYHIQ